MIHQAFEGCLFVGYISIVIVLYCIICFATHNKKLQSLPFIIKLNI